MKPTFFLFLALAITAGLSGCVHNRMFYRSHGNECEATTCPHGVAKPAPCCVHGCVAHICGMHCPAAAHAYGADGPVFTPGPPTAAVAYPYYTTRGPRDFLVDNPPTIGP
jgi:hypothetical protein